MNIDSTVKILETLKWPIVTAIIGIVAIFRLAPYIGNLISRITKIHKDGLEVGKIKDQAHQKQITAKDLMKIFDNRLLLETEESIKSDLDKISHDSLEEKEALLIKLYASEKIARCFDQTYNLIFGSQINALQHLNSFAGRVIDNNEINSFYEDAKMNYPLFYNTYPFDSWLRFMESAVLVLRQGNSVGITIRGQEFLKYLIDQGLSHNKTG